MHIQVLFGTTLTMYTGVDANYRTQKEKCPERTQRPQHIKKRLYIYYEYHTHIKK